MDFCDITFVNVTILNGPGKNSFGAGKIVNSVFAI